MSIHVLLNLLNELGEDKIQGLSSILSLFRNAFNKFNNTGARTLDFMYMYVYHMTLTTLKSLFFREQPCMYIRGYCGTHQNL